MGNIKIFLSCQIMLDLFYFLVDILSWKLVETVFTHQLCQFTSNINFVKFLVSCRLIKILLESFQLSLRGYFH